MPTLRFSPPVFATPYAGGLIAIELLIFLIHMTTRLASETLIAHLRGGDERAFQHLYEHYHTALLGVITQMVKDPIEAQDLLQDTYAKSWQRFHSYNPQQGGLFNWLLTIARNTALDALRRGKCVQFTSLTALDTLPVTMSYQPVTDTIGIEHLVRQLLLPHQWQVIDLAYWQGYTYREIANQLVLPLGTVKSRVRQALIRLRPHFDYQYNRYPS